MIDAIAQIQFSVGLPSRFTDQHDTNTVWHHKFTDIILKRTKLTRYTHAYVSTKKRGLQAAIIENALGQAF